MATDFASLTSRGCWAIIRCSGGSMVALVQCALRLFMQHNITRFCEDRMTPKPMYLAEWAYYAPSVVPTCYPPEVCNFFIGVVLLEMPGSVISEPTDMATVL